MDPKPPRCPSCEGSGETFHKACSVPDCEHAEPCPLCGGNGRMPTLGEVADLRQERDKLQGDLVVANLEIAGYRARGELHPFDRQHLELELRETQAEAERLRGALVDVLSCPTIVDAYRIASEALKRTLS